jgi:hypothetical protein
MRGEQLQVATINEIRYQRQDKTSNAGWYDTRRIAQYARGERVTFKVQHHTKRGVITNVNPESGIVKYHILSEGKWYRNIDETDIIKSPKQTVQWQRKQ